MKTDDSVEDESPEHEWAEFNLPFALLPGSPDEDDKLAFVGVGTLADSDPPDADS